MTGTRHARKIASKKTANPMSPVVAVCLGLARRLHDRRLCDELIWLIVIHNLFRITRDPISSHPSLVRRLGDERTR
jgi:hypothetical protein